MLPSFLKTNEAVTTTRTRTVRSYNCIKWLTWKEKWQSFLELSIQCRKKAALVSIVENTPLIKTKIQLLRSFSLHRFKRKLYLYNFMCDNPNVLKRAEILRSDQIMITPLYPGIEGISHDLIVRGQESPAVVRELGFRPHYYSDREGRALESLALAQQKRTQKFALFCSAADKRFTVMSEHPATSKVN